MAEFASLGCLKMEAEVPDEINQQFLTDIGQPPDDEVSNPMAYYGQVMKSSTKKGRFSAVRVLACEIMFACGLLSACEVIETQTRAC